MKSDSEGITVVPLEAHHMSQVIALLQDISPYFPLESEYNEIWQDFISQSHVASAVAIDGEVIVGYGAICIEFKIRGGKMGHIEDVVVHPQYRNRGIGKEILDYLYSVAKSRGCYKTALQCKDGNVVFYQNSGYRISGTAMQVFIES